MTSLCLQNNCCSTPGGAQPADPGAKPVRPHKTQKEALPGELSNWPKTIEALPDRGIAGVAKSRQSRESLAASGLSRGGGFMQDGHTSLLLGNEASELFQKKPGLPVDSQRLSSGQGVASSGQCSGRWADGSHVHVVQGSRIYWADGTTTEMEDTSSGGFTTTLWGTTYHGCLDADNTVIHWNDSSTWARLGEYESTLDGTWRCDSKALASRSGYQRHVITGNTLHWADGTTSEIQETVPGVFSTMRKTKSYFCRLELCGQRLRWNDGDCWLRLVHKNTGISPRRTRITLTCVAVVTVINCLFVLGLSFPCRRNWTEYPAAPKHPSWSWPEWQVWQFALGWAAMPLLLVHGLWATYLAIAADADLPQVLEMEAGKTGKPSMLWLLEPMRLVALLHIIYYHEAPTSAMGRWGFVWISFFMVLAGFVGAYQILVHDPDISKTTVPQHVWKRIKRLWPQYLVYVFVVSVPNYFSDSLAQGTVIPTLEGAIAATRKLWSWLGLLYVTGLQTLIPLDPHFDFVTKTCWFVPTLLLCEAFLPSWLRGIQALLELVAQRIAQQERLQGKVELGRLLPTALAFCFLAGAFTAVNAACIALGKVYLRVRAFPDNELSEAVFWFMRFSPLGHWPQVLLGAVLAKTFVMLQTNESDGPSSEEDAESCCPEEVMPLSQPGRSVVLMTQDPNSEEVTPSYRSLHQVMHTGPWLLAAVCVACSICLTVHISTNVITNSTVIFLNCGAPAISFAAMVLCLAQASLLLEPQRVVLKGVQVMGAVCFPAYLFVSMSEQLLWHFCSIVLDSHSSFVAAHAFRIPFLALVQQLWNWANATVFPGSK